ncbi:MAG: MBL fold metallo-hydrolase [Prevotella sp.]|nr:MBL fold metallo-hydrolase [Prevotella sp.]
MRLTFLGTGTSCGVPVIGCKCEVCQSADPHDKRTRCSALIETDKTRLLIDCGPDFRQQILPQPFRKIDAILITHAHYDHMGGMDDIRPYCQFGEMNVYADSLACKGMLEMLPYCFAEHRYPGVPAIGLHEILPHQKLSFGDLEVIPFEVMHGKLPILGYRIGELAYITDMKTINESELDYLKDVKVLVVNALRYDKPHHSHQLVDEAVVFAHRVGAERTFIIHSCHDIGLHEEVNRKLPAGIELAYDGQVITI